MNTKKDRTQIHITVDNKDLELFQNNYPYCLSRLVRNVIKLSINNPDKFKELFFYGINNK